MKLFKIFLIAIALIFAIQYIFRFKVKTKATKLQVYNPTQDTILVYLTLDDNGENWVDSVNGIFGIKSTNKLQGAFNLFPKQLVSYTSTKPISGNISFTNPPLNCPFPAPTLYEFTLNNKSTLSKAQETIDISCVFGLNTIGSISMSGGGVWNSGQNDTITKVQNNILYKNTGIAGVYPYGCTTCTGRSGMIDCSNKEKYEKVNKKNICNVQRDAENNGGIVKITYIKGVN